MKFRGRTHWSCLCFSIAICIFCFVGTAHPQPRYQIISDYDDTIKITNVSDRAESALNTLFSVGVFTGMNHLFQNYESKQWPISIVSAGLSIAKALILSDLVHNDIPFTHLYLRNPMRETTFHYKYRRIFRLTDQYWAPAVLIGDDTEIDPEVFNQFYNDRPDRVAAAYIHQVTGRPLPHGLTAYFSSYEVALYEYQSQRLDREGLLQVAHSILRASDPNLVFPAFTRCPNALSDLSELLAQPAAQDDFSELTSKVATHLISLCRSR